MSRILLLVDEAENRQILAQQLARHYDVSLMENHRGQPVKGRQGRTCLGSVEESLWNSIDLCIVDRSNLERHQQQLLARKILHDSVKWAVLLVADLEELMDLENDGQHTKLYDDAIASPIRPEELGYRVGKLLRSPCRKAKSLAHLPPSFGECLLPQTENERGLCCRLPSERSPQTPVQNPHLERQLQRNEDLFRLLVEGIRDYAIFLLDSTGHVASWNKGAERIFRYRSAEILGQHFSCFYPHEDIGTRKPEKELQLVATAGQCEDEGWRIRANRQLFWASMTITALHDSQGELVGFSVITHDLSDRKAVEIELCSLNRALRTIWECNQAMVRAEAESELLHEICRIIVETGGYRLAWVAFAENAEASPDESKHLQLMAHAGHEDGYLNSFQLTWGNSELGIGLTAKAIRTGIACVVQNIQTETSFAPWREAALARGLHSTISLPLKGEDRILGALRIYSGSPNAFDLAEVQLLAELADDLAYGIMAQRDRAQRKRAEEALAKSEERYRQLVELSPEAIFVHSEGKIDLINSAGARLLGATDPQQLIGKPLIELVHPDDRPRLQQQIRQIQQQKQAVPFIEQKLLRLDGTAVPVELAGTPLGEDNPMQHVLAVARDLSDRKQMEAALRESEELHRITLSNISEAVLLTDSSGVLTYVSPSVSSIFECSVEEVYRLGHITELLGSDLFDNAQLATVGEIHNLEREITNKSGKQHTLLVSAKKVSIKGSTVLYTCRDITGRKQAEEALRESENRFRTTFEGSAIGMALIDPAGQFIQINPAFQKMLGYSQQQLCQLRFRDITHPEDLNSSLIPYQQMLAGQCDRYQIEKRYIRADGSLVWVRLSVSSIRDRLMSQQFAIAMVEDITERKQAEEELTLHRHHLEELVAERTTELRCALDRLQQEIHRREQAQEALIRVTQAVESTSDAVAMTDMSGQSIYHNRAFLELFEYTVEDLNAAGGLPVLFADTTLGENVLNSIRQGNSWSCEVIMQKPRWKTPQGDRACSLVSIWLRADAVKDENNKLVGSIVVHTDITERKQAEAALRESEEQLRTLINAMPDIVCFKDARGGWLEANDAIVQAFQLIGQDYRGKKDSELAQLSQFYRDAFLQCERTDEDAWKQQTLSHTEEVIPRPDGTERIFDVIKVPLFYVNGTRKGIVVLGRDITERKQAEEERLRLASIVESSDDAIIGKTLDGIIQSWNAGAERIYGYTAEEVKGRSISIVVLPKREESELGLFERIQDGASIDHYETVHIRKDGSPIHVSLTISPIKDAAGRIVGVSTIARDITDLKRIEEALERLRHQNELILNSAGEGICGVDRHGKTTFVNPAAAKMLGYPMGELLGAPLAMILEQPQMGGGTSGERSLRLPVDASLTADSLVAPIYAAIKDGSVHHGTNEVFWRKDGSSFPVEYISTPIQEQNQIVGAVVTFKDITERLAVERMKDEFISVVSHELRTPLTSIRGSLGLLAGGVLTSHPDKASRMLEIAVSNTDRLVRLINDILDLERIQSGKVTMVNQKCNAAELMSQATDAMRTMAEKAGVTLSIAPLDFQLSGDPDRLFQVLTNLLSNAIKFSPEGGTVWLSASVREKEEVGSTNSGSKLQHRGLDLQASEVLFQITDEGRGIPADKLDTVFERFQQVDASDSRKKGGTGLGLAICRSIVEHHGGRIWVESVLGEGSTFYFTVPQENKSPAPEAFRYPFAQGTDAPDPIATDPDPRSDRSTLPIVLLADDRHTSRYIVEALVQQGGYQALAVASGEELVNLAAHISPALIVLNLSVPSLKGWETMVALKQCAQTRNIPAILLSALPPSAQSCSYSDMTAWICQSLHESFFNFKPDEIFPSLEKALDRSSKIARILIVEDDPDLAQVLIGSFEHHCIQTFHARTGRQAIELSQKVIPDLLVLDLVLPECDGFAVVNWLRQHHLLARTSLIVYSAKPLDRIEREQLTLGYTQFLTKGSMPLQEFERQILALVNQIIHTAR